MCVIMSHFIKSLNQFIVITCSSEQRSFGSISRCGSSL